MAPAFPIPVYLAVAALIAATALGIAQVEQGMGMPFMLIATFAWMTYSLSRQRKEQNNG